MTDTSYIQPLEGGIIAMQLPNMTVAQELKNLLVADVKKKEVPYFQKNTTQSPFGLTVSPDISIVCEKEKEEKYQPLLQAMTSVFEESIYHFTNVVTITNIKIYTDMKHGKDECYEQHTLYIYYTYQRKEAFFTIPIKSILLSQENPSNLIWQLFARHVLATFLNEQNTQDLSTESTSDELFTTEHKQLIDGLLERFNTPKGEVTLSLTGISASLAKIEPNFRKNQLVLYPKFDAEFTMLKTLPEGSKKPYIHNKAYATFCTFSELEEDCSLKDTVLSYQEIDHMCDDETYYLLSPITKQDILNTVRNNFKKGFVDAECPENNTLVYIISLFGKYDIRVKIDIDRKNTSNTVNLQLYEDINLPTAKTLVSILTYTDIVFPLNGEMIDSQQAIVETLEIVNHVYDHYILSDLDLRN